MAFRRFVPRPEYPSAPPRARPSDKGSRRSPVRVAVGHLPVDGLD